MRSQNYIALILFGLTISSAIAEKEHGRSRCGEHCTTKAPSTTALSAEESHALTLMREEEKLARDVYLTLGKKYNQRVFSNIPRAEQHHMDAILNLLNAYGLEDPALEPGKFSNEKLQRLHDELVARGSESKEAAFLVGALIEEVDIADLMTSIKETTKEDLRSVYENLLRGSERHLNAFVRNYEAVSGKTYVAQKMTAQEVASILGR